MINIAAIWKPDIQQQNYRSVLDAMSRPGTCHSLCVDSNDQVFIALLACLMDKAVTLADPHQVMTQDTIRLLQAQINCSEQADFIVCRGIEKPNFIPKLGTLPSPELSATVIILIEKIQQPPMGDLNLQLTGPGVNGTCQSAITGLDAQWLSVREEWVSRFPLGVDMLLVDDANVMALPRTTKVEII